MRGIAAVTPTVDGKRHTTAASWQLHIRGTSSPTVGELNASGYIHLCICVASGTRRPRLDSAGLRRVNVNGWRAQCNWIYPLLHLRDAVSIEIGVCTLTDQESRRNGIIGCQLSRMRRAGTLASDRPGVERTPCVASSDVRKRCLPQLAITEVRHHNSSL